MRPFGAEGRICIDITDPVTGKIKNRVKGKNTILLDSFFSGLNCNWIAAISDVYLVLTDSVAVIDPYMPYVLGQVLGYGVPSQSGSGSYRGAYNVANQILAARTDLGVSWKFQYDFTVAQANGNIGTIGLTHQFTGASKTKFDCIKRPSDTYQSYYSYTSDGRYTYACSLAGVVSIYDHYLDTVRTVNVSAIVGSSSSENKTVGFAQATGKYYIHVYNSSTPANRKMYVFADDTFSSAEATYSFSNSSISTITPMYIYGNEAFWLSGSTIKYADFVNDIAPTTQTITSSCNISGSTDYSFAIGSVCNDKYIFIVGHYQSYSYKPGIVYDMSTRSLIGYTVCPGGSQTSPAVMHQLSDVLPCVSNVSAMYNNGAIAIKKLDEVVEKTSSNGLTATYEIEVYW